MPSFFMQKARFSVCHTPVMKNLDLYTREELNAIRNFLKLPESRLFISYFSDLMTDFSRNPNQNAETIRGMAILLHEIKTFPKEVEQVLKRSN